MTIYAAARMSYISETLSQAPTLLPMHPYLCFFFFSFKDLVCCMYTLATYNIGIALWASPPPPPPPPPPLLISMCMSVYMYIYISLAEIMNMHHAVHLYNPAHTIYMHAALHICMHSDMQGRGLYTLPLHPCVHRVH